MKKINLILGTMTIGEQVFGEDAKKMVSYALENGIVELDTAYVYNEGQCEKILGDVLSDISRNSYRIATKVNPRISGKLDAEAAYNQLNESLKRMQVSSVDTFYLHFPDPNTPVDSVLEACANLNKEGKFSELGLSNFPAWLVTQVYYKRKENGYILPTVYEGLYNPLSRRAENELDRCLTELKFRFNAYNPLAGGILTNKYNSFEEAPVEGRFTYRPNYQARYWKKSYFEAAGLIKEACKKYDITIIEATYRWLAYHSMLKADRADGLIIGASRLSQLEQNIEGFNKGELPSDLLEVFEKAWQISKSDAPEYFKFYGSK
ncbi:MAG: aldo/keto reductase [Candidatus Riflebacteria bacterium]|nr:aldo/keto reductase [Candidatus Riflebacteria bacterium]